MCAEADGGIQLLLESKPLLLATVSCIGDESLGVVKHATSTITAISTSTPGAAAVFSDSGLTILAQIMTKSDSYRFNVYDVSFYFICYVSSFNVF